MRTLFIILSLSFSFHLSLFAQIDKDIPFIGYFGGYKEDRVLKNDSSGYLFIPYVDTNIIVFLSKKYTDYKMYDRKNHIILEGDIGGRIYTDYFKRFGKWTAYYPETGKPKVIGYYHADLPVGLWKYFYPNGLIKQTFSVSQILADSIYITCKVGMYEEYYETGQLKISGFYKIMSDSTTVPLYDFNIGNFKDTRVKAPVSKPFGIWKYFRENGELEKKEEYY